MESGNAVSCPLKQAKKASAWMPGAGQLVGVKVGFSTGLCEAYS
jgi:hypothetical protein